MTTLLYKNQATSILANDISASSLTITLQSGGGALFPTPTSGQGFYISLISASTNIAGEVCLCTSRTGDTLTVQRAQQGTTGQAWAAGSLVSQLVTMGDMNNMVQVDELQSSVYFFTHGTGTGNSIIATLPSGLSSLPDGFQFTIAAPAANTGPVTLTLTFGANLLPAYPIVKFSQSALSASDIPSAEYPIELSWSAAWNAFVMTNPATSVVADVSGGAANELLIQTAPGSTGFVSAPTSAGQVLEYNGTSVGWAAAAVQSFNGRTGNVTPQSGDYTAAQVGAISTASVTGANQQLSTSGYQVMPGGVIMQWGVVYPTSAPTFVTWPLQFPNAVVSIQVTPFADGKRSGAVASPSDTGQPAPTVSGAWLGVGEGGSSSWQVFPFYWLAIGY